MKKKICVGWLVFLLLGCLLGCNKKHSDEVFVDRTTKIEENTENTEEPVTEATEASIPKEWFLTKSTVSIYNFQKEEISPYKLDLKEVPMALVDEFEAFYKYDSKGRMVETNAGSYPALLAKNDGTCRTNDSVARIDRDMYAKRAGKDADYMDYLTSADDYMYMDNIDNQNTFRFSYNEDGSVTEDILRDGDILYKNKYVFQGNLLSSWDVLEVDSGRVKYSYSNFKYNGSYVSFMNDNQVTKYWEEKYNSNGKLEAMLLELDADDCEFANPGFTDLKFVYYFNDSVDENGNIIRRTQKMDIIGGTLGGRNSDGTYYKWETIRTGIVTKVVNYQYEYLAIGEIAEKNSSFEEEENKTEETAENTDAFKSNGAEQYLKDKVCAGYKMLVPSGFRMINDEDEISLFQDDRDTTSLEWGGADVESVGYEKAGFLYFSSGYELQEYVKSWNTHELALDTASDNYYCYSYLAGNQIVYEAFHCDEQLLYGFSFRYAKEDKEYYDALVSRLSEYITKNQGRY